jgi:L-fucose mutarotase
MLIGLDPIIGPELLYHLRAMGHGDEVALVDANYPALEDARRLVRADGVDLLNILKAILPIFPIDDHENGSFFRAVYAPQPDLMLPIYQKINALCSELKPGSKVFPLDPETFYSRVRSAHLVIATGEKALYANVILRKGAIAQKEDG